MKYRTIGSDPATRREVSVLALGAMLFGSVTDEKTSFAVLDRYVEASRNFIDTSDNYAFWVDGGQGGQSRDPQAGQGLQRLLGGAVVDAAARDDQRPGGGPDRLRGVGQFQRVGGGAADPPDPVGEELLRPVGRLGLHVLRQRERHGPGLGRVGEHPHGVERGGDQCLGAGDPVGIRETGRSVSLTDASPARGCSSCWSSGSAACEAK
ncbi:hypothetical protein SFUMM280S_07069 [Streptomyces fumanus]